MGDQHATWSDSISIASDTDSACRIMDRLLDQMKLLEWEDHDIFAVHLAVEEALVNAIKHGNQKDASKAVHVSLSVSRDLVEISIRDEGGGFDPEDVPDPTDEDNLELPSGRGLMLMRTYMSSVQFNESGNQVVMTKRRSAPRIDDEDDEDDDAA